MAHRAWRRALTAEDKEKAQSAERFALYASAFNAMRHALCASAFTPCASAMPEFKHKPLSMELLTDEIHIWSVPLDQAASRFQTLSQTLSPDERLRAERFHFERDRNHFISSRGILRTILGGYLGVEPDKLQFCYGKHGKPVLADLSAKGRICFNSSRSEGLALYAFTRDREIGVDIEHIRDIPEMEHIVERFFSKREKVVFYSLPESRKKEAFFNCWTRKEAFIKAVGDGLYCPLDQLDVSLFPGEQARLLRIKGDLDEASRWSIQDLKPASEFAAACAVERGSYRFLNCRWSN